MSNSTTWMNKKSKKTSSKTKNITTPSNLKHLPLETYMIPTTRINDESAVVNKSATKSTTITASSKSTATAYITMLITIFSNFAAFLDGNETAVSKLIAESLSGSTNTSSDVTVIKENLIIFLNVLLSSYIVYNLYYCSFYTDADGNPMKQFEFSIGELKKQNGILHFFLKYILCTLSMLITLMKDIIPKGTEKYVNINVNTDRRVHFIILFIVVNLVVKYYGGSILNSANDSTSTGIYSVIFLMYAGYTMLSDFNITKKDFNMAAIRLKYTAMGGFTPLFIVIIFSLRMIGSITMIPLTLVINCSYIIYRSCITLLGITVFNKIKEINKFVLLPTDSRNYKETGQKGDSTNLFLRILNKTIIYAFHYLFEITFLVVFVYGMFDYSLNMTDTPQLQGIMISLCSIAVLIILYVTYKKLTSITKLITNDTKKAIPIEPQNQKTFNKIDNVGIHAEDGIRLAEKTGDNAIPNIASLKTLQKLDNVGQMVRNAEDEGIRLAEKTGEEFSNKLKGKFSTAILPKVKLPGVFGMLGKI